MRALALLAAVAIGVPAFVAACGKTKSTRLSPQECNALRSAAVTSAQKAPSEPACYAHADCEEVALPSCAEACGGYAAPKAARSAVASASRQVEDGPCKKWKDEECDRIAPMPIASCPAFVPRCSTGRCIMRSQLDILPAAECEALLAESRREVDAKLAAADRACKKDDDCTLTTGGCVGGCGGPAIAKTGESAYKADYASVAAKCKKWWDGECMSTTPQAIPSCAQVRAKCVGGKCAASFGPQ